MVKSGNLSAVNKRYDPPSEDFIITATVLFSLLLHLAILIWAPYPSVRHEVYVLTGQNEHTPEVALRRLLTAPKKKKRPPKKEHGRKIEETAQPAAQPQVKDFKDAIVEQVRPHYPRSALRKGWEGEVELRFRVGAKGEVLEVIVIKADIRSIFNQSALRAAQSWRFRPSLDGQEYIVVQTVKFRLTD